MVQQGEFDSVIVAFQEDVVRIEFAVDDTAGVQVARRLRHLPRDADGRSHPAQIDNNIEPTCCAVVNFFPSQGENEKKD